MKQFRKFTQLFFGVAAFMLLMALVGIEVASKSDNISVEQTKAQCVLILIVLILSVLIVKKLGKRKEEDYE